MEKTQNRQTWGLEMVEGHEESQVKHGCPTVELRFVLRPFMSASGSSTALLRKQAAHNTSDRNRSRQSWEDNS